MISFDDLIKAVIGAESGGNPSAVSPKGAQGLMQVMPATAKNPGFGVKPLANPMDPVENERFGREYLGAMLNRYDGDMESALAAYNWGVGNADMWSKSGKPIERLPAETRGYIKRILGNLPAGGAAPSAEMVQAEPARPVALAPERALTQPTSPDLSGFNPLSFLVGSAQAAELPQAQPSAPSPTGTVPAAPRVATIRSNIERMIAQKAPEADIDAYLAQEGFSLEQWRSAARDLDKTLDRKRGAPASVRMIVGGAPEKDRLANLRRFYSDAIPYGDGNFVFTDPETKRLTLYNPKGLDVGDIPSVAREMTEAVGGTFGAAAGTPLGPAGTAVGAGLGTAAGGALYDLAGSALGTIDTRSGMQAAGDAVAGFAGGAAGQRVGEALEGGARAVIGAAKQRMSGTASQLARDFAQEGVEAPAGAVSGSRLIQSTEHALAASPGGAGPMQDRAERVMGQFRDAADRLVTRFGPTLTPEGAGARIKQGVSAAGDRFKARQALLYDDAFDAVGKDAATAVPAVTALREELEQELARAPNRSAVLKPIIEKAKAIEGDSTKGLPFDAFRATRTDIGRDLDNPLLAGATSAQSVAWRRLYGAMSEDMKAAAKTAGVDAAKKLDVADRYTRFQADRTLPTLQKIVDMDADAQAFNYAMAGAKDGGERLLKLRRSLSAEEWDAVAGTVLGRMGRAKPGQQDATGEAFSIATFLTNWNAISPEAKAALFDGKRYAPLRDSLDRLVRMAGALKETDKMANHSGTSRIAAYQAAISTLGGIAAGGMFAGPEGGIGGGLATYGGAVLAPRLTAKLITNPRFVNWLAAAPQQMVRENGVPEHMGRLIGIAQFEPEMRDAIGQYIAAYRLPPLEAQGTGSGRTPPR